MDDNPESVHIPNPILKRRKLENKHPSRKDDRGGGMRVLQAGKWLNRSCSLSWPRQNSTPLNTSSRVEDGLRYKANVTPESVHQYIVLTSIGDIVERHDSNSIVEENAMGRESSALEQVLLLIVG